MMEEDLSSRAAEMARGTMCFINTMGFLASPRLIAKAPTLPSREHILEHIDSFVRVLASAASSTQTSEGGTWRDSEPHVLRLRELFRKWMPERGLSPEIIQTARKCLLALGVSEPPEGWDVFENTEDDSPITDSRAAETTPVREALAVSWRFINWASIFVIPAFLACHDPEELRAELLQRIGRYLEIIDLVRDHPVQRHDDERGLLGLEAFALKLRTLLQAWNRDQPVPSEIIQTVDACLKAVGVVYPTTDNGA